MATNGNPLLAAAAKKKSKKDISNQGAFKRRYNEETPGGLLIVRAPPSDASTRLARARAPAAGPGNPPAKKFKADAPMGLSVTSPPARNASVDPVVEQAVRAMDDEADSLRRASRATATIPSALASSVAFLPSSPEKPPKPMRAKKKVTVETEEPLRDGTPQGVRNKILRGDAMAAIARDADPEPDTPGHRRRSSLGGRGKRISSSFQTGKFTEPHAKVNEESFYKHIDRDLSDLEQLRQLLTWSASRAATNMAPSSSLHPRDVSGLKTIQGAMVNMLIERYLDLSLFGPEDADAAATGENAQNEKNRHWNEVYTGDIEHAEEEMEQWKYTEYFYETYAKKERKAIEERKRARADKGKRPAGAGDPWPWPDERFLLDERFRRGLQLAQAPPSPAAAQIKAHLADLQFKFDTLNTNLHAARTHVRVAGRALNARFGLVGAGLAARAGADAGPSVGAGVGARTDVQGMLRALARVDMERPPAQVGDAARRAAREVQRAARAGEGERRVTLTGAGTGAAGGGTPRRAGTPRRERTPGRERTSA
ncbi:Mis12-Mtw1 protein family-domain-containing protein [Mycena epipterygia]|nr:Mis12-Mtw1 protein family-domain-containing protein [Mycena epipterygia]